MHLDTHRILVSIPHPSPVHQGLWTGLDWIASASARTIELQAASFELDRALARSRNNKVNNRWSWPFLHSHLSLEAHHIRKSKKHPSLSKLLEPRPGGTAVCCRWCSSQDRSRYIDGLHCSTHRTIVHLLYPSLAVSLLSCIHSPTSGHAEHERLCGYRPFFNLQAFSARSNSTLLQWKGR